MNTQTATGKNTRKGPATQKGPGANLAAKTTTEPKRVRGSKSNARPTGPTTARHIDIPEAMYAQVRVANALYSVGNPGQKQTIHDTLIDCIALGVKIKQAQQAGKSDADILALIAE